VAENYRLVRNKANRFLQDREEMKTQTFIGLGKDFVVHDSWATESEGPIYDRTTEHLSYSDRGVSMLRKVAKEEIEKVARGQDPMGLYRGSEDMIVDTNFAESVKA